MSRVTVNAYRWDDECCPTVEPGTLSAREAAVELLSAIDWSVILDPGYIDRDDLDPLIGAGLHAELAAINWSLSLRFPGRPKSHLTAWVTSRLQRHRVCVEHADLCDDLIPFDDCWHDPDEDDDPRPCAWTSCWALHGDPDDFLDVAIELFRDGWEPPPAFEWVGGPSDGAVIVLPGTLDRVRLALPPLGESIDLPTSASAQVPTEYVEVRLERRASDGRLIARWPYDLLP